MADSRYLSTEEAAHILGVSVTTVKRWVDEGIIPAHRTAGKHRKVLRAELAEMIQAGHLPCANEILPVKAPSSRPAPEDLTRVSEQFRSALQSDDGCTVRTLLLDLHTAGVPVATLGDRVIAPAMTWVGREWERGRIDVYHEHRCTQLCLNALQALRTNLEMDRQRNQPNRLDAPLALGGSPEGDHYQLAGLLAELVLLECGWRAIQLGTNTPLASFRQAVLHYRPRLVWLSAGYLPEPDVFLREYRTFYALCEQLGVAVAVGGRTLTDTLRSQMLYTTFGDGLSHLAAFARSLYPPASPRN